MKTMGLFAVVSSSVLAFASPSLGQQCGPTLADEFRHAYRQEAIWPSQYSQAPRQTICSTFELMVQNGWRRQNLLGQYHFKPGATELSEAGQLKAQWILTQTPQSRRTIYVEKGANEEQTAARIAAVQQWASGTTLQTSPEISETHIVDYGRPAATVDAVFTGWSANQPAPVLPKAGAGSSSSGSN